MMFERGTSVPTDMIEQDIADNGIKPTTWFVPIIDTTRGETAIMWVAETHATVILDTLNQ